MARLCQIGGTKENVTYIKELACDFSKVETKKWHKLEYNS